MNGLEREYTGVLEVDIIDATTEQSKIKIDEYGFENHGLVMFDSDGTLQKNMDGHEWTEQQIRDALQDVMGGV